MKKYLAGISGGPDSIALLYKYRHSIKAVCCVNYHIRENSDNDVSIVQEMCQKYHIQCFIKNVNYEDFKNSKQNNFEAWARNIRYDFFVKIANQLNLKKIYIAHNFNDWLETAYMNLIRKSKALYYGIQSQSKYKGLLIKRPLLRFKKLTLQRFDDEHHLKYAIDITNFSDDYERNRIRKLINKWNSFETLNFKKRIDTYNKKNKKNLKQINKYFKIWTKSDFNVNKLKEIHKNNSQCTYYLVYNYLRLFLVEHINYQKIINIINFIFSKNNPNNYYRLGNDYILYKIKLNKEWFLKIQKK